MKRIVITGGTGAIGHALIRKCIAQNDSIYVICRPDSKRIKTLMSYGEKINIIQLDLGDLSAAADIINSDCDIFYHLAWDGTTGNNRNNIYLQNCNIQYTLDAVELAHRLGCRTFIGAGSQAEYGRCSGKLSPDTPAFPENGYGMAKLCAGMMSRVQCEQYGIRHIWTRILSVYGPYDRDDSMVMSAIRRLDRGEIPEFTRGEQNWDYIYSKDVANIMYLLSEKGKDGRVYCIGSGNVRKLAELIEVLRITVNPRGTVKLGAIPYAANQVMYLQADTTAIQEDLGYRCEYSFEKGVEETVQWYRGSINEKN